jgi:hypothetical protein
MYIRHSKIATLILASLLLMSMSGLSSARSYYYDDDDYDDDCMSNYAIWRLAAQSYWALRSISEEVSFIDLYYTIRSSSYCVTFEGANEVIETYANSLLKDDSTINHPPVITGVPATQGSEGAFYSFSPEASDPDGDSLKFQIENLPPWASYNTSTGTLSGNPGYSDAGTYNEILISVSDGQAITSLATFSITITDTNQPPSISGSPDGQIAEGESYLFIPQASDPDGNELNFSVSGLPDWASFNSNDGTLSGIPDFTDAGTYQGIIVSVSDGESSASLSPFTIEVTNLNRPPSISGIPSDSITVGELYSFSPTTFDPDEESLSYSVDNLPAWAEFDPVTGTLSGIPESVDVGLYEDITITVTDGSVSASLSNLSILVNAEVSPTGIVQLAWKVPETRTDGTLLSLDDVAGFKVYMGTSTENLEMLVDLGQDLTTSYVVTGLDAGIYYFTVTTYDIEGNESPFSNIAEKQVL